MEIECIEVWAVICWNIFVKIWFFHVISHLVRIFNRFRGNDGNGETTVCILIHRTRDRLIHIFRDGSMRYWKLFRRNVGRAAYSLQPKVTLPFRLAIKKPSWLHLMDISSLHSQRDLPRSRKNEKTKFFFQESHPDITFRIYHFRQKPKNSFT